MTYLMFWRSVCSCEEQTVTSKPATCEEGMICGRRKEFLSSSFSTKSCTWIAVRRSLRMKKVFVFLDLTCTEPKSMKTGPAITRCSCSPESGCWMSRISAWLRGSAENFFFTSWSGFGSNFTTASSSCLSGS